MIDFLINIFVDTLELLGNPGRRKQRIKSESWIESRRRNAHLRKHGCVVFCKHCGAWLDGFSVNGKAPGLYIYNCGSCGKSSEFDFVSYPAPVLAKDCD